MFRTLRVKGMEYNPTLSLEIEKGGVRMGSTVKLSRTEDIARIEPSLACQVAVSSCAI